MNDFCVELDLDISPLCDGYDITSQSEWQKTISLDYINPKLVNFLSQYGLQAKWLEVHMRTPGYICKIHTDTFTSKGEYVKINWVYGGRNSYMSWYSPKNSKSGTSRLTDIEKTEFVEYQPYEVDLIATYPTHNKPYIVQAGVPHTVINPKETRYCLCCVLQTTSGGKPTMNEVKNLLINYISRG